MSTLTPAGATIPEVTHHTADINGANLHYVSAGSAGSPIVLVHGFPETWWAFRSVIPLLAAPHHVFAVDLPGLGDSDNADGDYSSVAAAANLHAFIDHLSVGPVHLTGQDFAGATVFRLAADHPEMVASLTAIEMGLAGFGAESLADVTHGGVWYIGVLTAPGIAEMLLAGREREFIGGFVFPAMTAVQGAVTDVDVDEFVRTYGRRDGFRGASGLYRSMLAEGDELQALAASSPLPMPVLAIGAGGGDFTHATMTQATAHPVRSILLEGVGHYAALEAPQQVAAAVLEFVDGVDAV